MKNLLLLFMSLLGCGIGYSQNGTIAGTLTDGSQNDVLPFANVAVQGTSSGSTTDFDGKYTINIEPGTYTVVFSFVGYQTKEISSVVVKAGQTTNLNVTLEASAGQLDEVVIKTTARKNTEAAVLSFQKNSVALVDGLSIETIKNIGVSDVANAVKNVPGVSVQGGKYVYVRGLGDRYTKSILNGVDVPGLDPDRNTLQLDVFPTQIIDNIIVVKTSTADQPADFTGGVVDIVTKDIPTRAQYSFSAGLGYNSDFHFNKNYLKQNSSGTDIIGFDDGQRSNPLATNQPVPLPQQDPQLVETLTKRFSPELAAQQDQSFMDFNLAATAGNQYDVGDNKLGYLASLSYRNETEYYDKYVDGQVYRKSDDHSVYTLDPDRTQEGRAGNNNVLISGLAGLSFKTDQSKYRINALHIQNGESQASIFRTIKRIDAINEVKKDNLLYTERAITNLLFEGTNTFDDAKWTLEYKLSPSFVNVYDKDFRVTPFRVREDQDGNEYFTIEPSESGEPTRIFRSLEETDLAGKMGVTLKNKLFGYDAKTKVGAAYTNKKRDFGVTQFAFPIINVPSAAYGGDPNQVLAPDNIYDADTNSGTFVRDDSNDSDSYSSEIEVAAGYVSEEFKLTDWWNAILGLRVEQFGLSYTGTSQSRGTYNNVKVIDKTDLYPSANLIFDLNEEESSKVRASFARTTARPSFKEASLAEIFDPINSTIFIGNIDIQPTYINNFDLRYENYGEGNNFFAVSGFYKSFKDPIEVSFIRGAAGQFTPLNLGDAKVFGGEVELRRNLGFIAGLRDFNFNANFSLVDSQQSYSADELANRRDNIRDGENLGSHRQLQGQSPYLLNIGFTYNNEDNGWQGTLSYNSQGKTLQIVGSQNIPDVYTLPFHNMKLNISKSFGTERNSTLSLRFENILNDDTESVYDSYGSEDVSYSKWNIGQKISLGYTINF